MERTTEAIIRFLLNRHYIGKKHFPEERLLKSRIKWLSKEERKGFEKEYYSFSKKYLLRLKKRTGKSSAYHISLKPSKLKEIYEMIKDE